MTRRWNIRLTCVAVLLGALVARELFFERHFVWLPPQQHMYAYVPNRTDGTLSILDLVHLSPLATIKIGAQPSGARIRPGTHELWGLSRAGGFLWIFDAPTRQVARIFLGREPSAFDFSRDGRTVYATVAGANQLAEIDARNRSVRRRATVGGQPENVVGSADGKSLFIANRHDGTLTIFDPARWTTRATIAVAPNPQEIAVLPDDSKIFVASATDDLLSVVDLRSPALVVNISLGGQAGDLIMKPDGGELYIPSPEAHGLLFVNTETNEVSDYMLLGLAPQSGIFAPDGRLIVEDTGAGRFVPVAPDDRVAAPSVPAGEGPVAAAFTPGGEMMLVVNSASNDVAVFRAKDNSLITRIPTGRDPQSVAVLLF